MPKAIVETTTQVIRRLTTDDAPDVASDESVIDLGDVDVDLAGGFKKIDAGGQVVLASDAEIDAAGVDEAKEAQKAVAKKQALFDAIDAIVAEKALPKTLMDYFIALKNLR